MQSYQQDNRTDDTYSNGTTSSQPTPFRLKPFGTTRSDRNAFLTTAYMLILG